MNTVRPMTIAKFFDFHPIDRSSGKFSTTHWQTSILESNQQISGVVLNLNHLEDVCAFLGSEQIEKWNLRGFYFSTRAIRNHAKDEKFVRILASNSKDPQAIFLSIKAAANFIQEGGMPEEDSELKKQILKAANISSNSLSQLNKSNGQNTHIPPTSTSTTPSHENKTPVTKSVIESSHVLPYHQALNKLREEEFQENTVIGITFSKGKTIQTFNTPIRGFFISSGLATGVARAMNTRTRSMPHASFYMHFRKDHLGKSMDPKYIVKSETGFGDNGNSPAYVSLATMKTLIDQKLIPFQFSEELDKRITESMTLLGKQTNKARPQQGTPARTQETAVQTPVAEPAANTSKNFNAKFEIPVLNEKIMDDLSDAFRDAVLNDKTTEIKLTDEITLTVTGNSNIIKNNPHAERTVAKATSAGRQDALKMAYQNLSLKGIYQICADMNPQGRKPVLLVLKKAPRYTKTLDF